MSTTEDRVADPAHEEAVIYQVTATAVAVLTLNRPDRLNTWGGDSARAFNAGLDRAEQDPAVRVIVSTDEGKLASLIGERQPYHLTTLSKPVVAAINGSCRCASTPACPVRRSPAKCRTPFTSTGSASGSPR